MLLKQLEDIGSSLATQVEQIISEASLEAVQDSLCWTTYAQQDILQLINGIKIVNLFESQKPAPLTPFACGVQPTDITVEGIHKGAFKTANLIGFNFYPRKIDKRFTDPVISAEFVDTDGPPVVVPGGVPSAFIAENGDFTIQLNLAAWDQTHRLSNKTAGIQFLFNGQPLDQGSVAISPTTMAPDAVTVSSVGFQVVSRGEPVELPVQATSSQGEKLTYGASGLPPGLSIDESSGVITGAATSRGIYTVTISATDPEGVSGSTSFKIAVNIAPLCHAVKNMVVCVD